MALNSINTNVASRLAYQSIAFANREATQSVARLSSGARIASASEDIAGLAAGTSLQTQVTSLRAGLKNASQTSSLLQVADGALAEITAILQRQKSLATQAASGALADTERAFLDQEFQALTKEIDRLAKSTNFNGVTPLYNQEARVNLNPALGAPVRAFDLITGNNRNGAGAGRLRFVDEAGNNLVGNQELSQLSPDIHGEIKNITLSNVQYNVAADISVEINGREFTGVIEHNRNFAFITNGTDYIELGTQNFRLDNEARAEFSRARMEQAFENTRIFRRSRLSDVDLSGTRLEGRNFRYFLDGHTFGESVDIGNFQYVGSQTGPNRSRLTVDINGDTFVATNVIDRIRNNTLIRFQNNDNIRERFDIRVGQIAAFEGDENIRESLDARQAFIDALNVGFARSSMALDVNLGGGTADNGLEIKLDPVISGALFEGKRLVLSDAGSAFAVGEQIDRAIEYVTSVRADVGSLQSRMDFAASNIQSSLQNQDAARAVYLDTDIAGESTSYTSSLVKSQASIAALAQANLLSSNLLDLL